MMSDISENEISVSESYQNHPSHLPKWAEKTLSSDGSNVGNPADPRRTWAYFQRVGIDLS